MTHDANFYMDALLDTVKNNALNDMIISMQSTREEADYTAIVLEICNRNGIKTSQLMAVARDLVDEGHVKGIFDTKAAD